METVVCYHQGFVPNWGQALLPQSGTMAVMDIPRWKERLTHLPLGELHFHPEVGSTNLEAEKLIQAGVEPFSLVIADSQTAGRGRQGRTWITRPGQALAFSWILFPEKGRIRPETLGRINGLGALAVAETIQEKYGLQSEIKWPNDVLIEGSKVAGILVEVHWQGCQLMDVILGIGINVGKESIPADPQFNFPATSLEGSAGKEINRLDLLVGLLESLLKWYRRLAEPSLIKAWNEHLAYKNQLVSLNSPNGPLTEGTLQGVEQDGSLILGTSTGEVRHFHSGVIQLRLVDRS
ncbi:MAG TPA: biotin--[acetyl-CoA-carboxylase] ligase [Chloroflexi bacterium]|nr:biotin--[acetyl-CoA-carboxylase] ligase [Chloroflexota bacterium]